MHEAHPSLQTIADLLSGEIEGDLLRREVVPHLLSACADCREHLQKIRRLLKSVDHWNESVAVREGLEAPTLLAELFDRPSEERLSALDEDSRVVSWGLCKLLIDTSRREVFDRPARAEEAAQLAVFVGERLGDETYHPDWVEDLRARAWAHLGNARRVLGELRGADEAFRRAEHHLGSGNSGRAVIAAELLHFRASHRRAQRRLPEARELLDRAIGLFSRAGDRQSVAKARLTLAKILEEADEITEAIDLLQAIDRSIDPGLDSRLSLYARHNLICCLILAERFSEAADLIPTVRQGFDGSESKPVDLVRLRWAEGRVTLGIGRPDEAAVILAEVQTFFLERQLSLDAALVSLDLAVAYAHQDRMEDLQRLAGQILPLFHAEDLHRETLAALYLFHQAVQKEVVTLELVVEVARFVRRGAGP